MNQRKQNLIEALERVVYNLKNGTLYYKWSHQNSCNCGVVVQSLLKLGLTEFYQKTESSYIFDNKTLAKYMGIEVEDTHATWKNAAAVYCPITGIPTQEIFKELYELGLTNEDINHLEFMTNEAILEKSGIITRNKKKFSLKNFFRSKNNNSISEGKYYTKKENLILYLSSWVKILKEENKIASLEFYTHENLLTLKEMLLNATAEADIDNVNLLRTRITRFELQN